MLTRSCVWVCSHAESCSDQTWIIQLKIVAQLQGPCDLRAQIALTLSGRLEDCCVCCLSLKAEITGCRAQIAPLPCHFATHSLVGLRQLGLQCRSLACMADDPVCSTSGRSEPARFNGGATTGSLAVGRKLQPKRFVRQQVCSAVFSTKYCPC